MMKLSGEDAGLLICKREFPRTLRLSDYGIAVVASKT